MNTMKHMRIEKITLNVGAGRSPGLLDKAERVLKDITGIDPKKTLTQKRVATWGLRPGLPVGCMVTLRGEAAGNVLKRLLVARENILEKRHFDKEGNVAFGILEHIDIEGVQYDPKIGVIGMQVCVTLERPGFHVKRRRVQQKRVGKHHRITQDDAIAYMKQQFNVSLKGEAA